MISKRLRGLGVALGLVLASGGCVDDYGYGGMQVGYGVGGYGGDPYADGYGYDAYGYGNGGYGYSPSWFGWYNNFYYPGSGIYVYDQYRRPFRWNGAQQRYWSGQQRFRGQGWDGRGNWNGFDRRQPNRGYDGNSQWQSNGGNRQGQRYPGGNRPWRGATDGTRQWQPNPNGTAPGNGGRGWRGAGRQDGRQGFAPRSQSFQPAPGTGRDIQRSAPQAQPQQRAPDRGQGRGNGMAAGRRAEMNGAGQIREP